MKLAVCKTYLRTCLSESVSSMYHVPYYSLAEITVLLFGEVTVLQLMVANWALTTAITVKQENKRKKAFK